MAKKTIPCPGCTGRCLPKRMKKHGPTSELMVCADCGGSGLVTKAQADTAAINDEIGALNFQPV